MRLTKTKLARLLQKNTRFLLTTHFHPDADGIGSQLAFHAYLKQLRKHSIIINPSPTPDKFRFLDVGSEITSHSPETIIPPIDVVLVFDTNEVKMLGALGIALKSLGVPIVFIDHHVTDDEKPYRYYRTTDTGSTGELVLDYLRWADAKITRRMALALYTAIAFDSEHFRKDHHAIESHRRAAELLSLGVSAERVHRELYGRSSFSKVRLLGDVLSKIHRSEDGRIAWLTVTLESRLRHGATVEDTESFINQLILIEGVEVALFFREDDSGVIKVGMRGRRVPVLDIAEKFQGGGHRLACGARIRAPLHQAVREVVSEAHEVLATYFAKRAA